jgi:pyruvate/2-oxoglutarate dehydrogenase complex dihydrolipoamide acyltransferase (E2) component
VEYPEIPSSFRGGLVMPGKKKAYQRFEELIKQATAPSAAETEAPEAQSLSIWLSPAVRRALEQHATAVGSTPSEVVEEAVRRYLVERPG